MPKRLLIETRMDSLSLCESKSKSPRPGYLCTISGPCADLDNPTRNNNFYSRRLWENVFKNDIVRESLEDRILIGELDHPMDRLETKATNACIVMTDYSFNDKDKVLEGTFDVLDTPHGRILKSLLDYGCRIGVSSRGEGDVVEDENGVSVVDEDSYEFVAFDAVVLPAVKAAKPTIRESLNRASLTESLKKEISGATTMSELNLIKSVVEATNLPDADSLMESVNDKSQELSNGATGSSTLIEDLERAQDEIERLKTENKKLRSDVVTYKSKFNSQFRSRQKSVVESRKQISELRKKFSSHVRMGVNISDKLEMTESSLRRSRSEVERLRRDLSSKDSSLSECKTTISRLEDSLSQSQSMSRDQSREIQSLRRRVESLKEEGTKKLEESTSRGRQLRSSYESVKGRLTESQSALRKTRDAYITEWCKRFRVNPDKVFKLVGPTTVLEDVKRVLDSYQDQIERKSKVPVVHDELIGLLEGCRVLVNEGNNPGNFDPETDQTVRFMDEANKFF